MSRGSLIYKTERVMILVDYNLQTEELTSSLIGLYSGRTEVMEKIKCFILLIKGRCGKHQWQEYLCHPQ